MTFAAPGPTTARTHDLAPASTSHPAASQTATQRPPRTPVRARLLAVGAAAVLGLLASGTPASAHDTILGTTPGDGETLAAAPTSISVEMSDEPQAIAPRFRVTATDGSVVYDEEPTIDGRFATADLPVLPNDTYQVAWRLVSSDGHPIQGVFAFTVADPAAVEPSQTPSETSDAPAGTAADTAESTEPAPTTSEPSASTSSDEASSTSSDSDEKSGSSWLTATGIVIVIVFALLALVVLLRRRTTLKDQP